MDLPPPEALTDTTVEGKIVANHRLEAFTMKEYTSFLNTLMDQKQLIMPYPASRGQV